MTDKFYFKCTSSGPDAPLLVLDTYWEAKEMESHPEYIRVLEDGTPIRNVEKEEAPSRFPFMGVPPQQPRRPTLGVKRK
jgi:hypothetical protein